MSSGSSGLGEQQPHDHPLSATVDSMSTMSTSSSSCDWCQKMCKPRRCTRCSQAAFCSRTCQRADWDDREKGHRNACDVIYSVRRAESSGRSSGHQLPALIPSGDVETAQAELQTILSSRLANMSMDGVQEEYYKTMDAIQQVEAVLAKNGEKKSEVGATAKATKPKAGSAAPAATSSTNQMMPPTLQQTSHNSPAKQHKRAIPSVFECVAENYQCFVERLPHVSCYSITLTHRAKTGKCDSLPDRLRLSIGYDAKDKNTRALLSLAGDADRNSNGDQQGVLLSASLPGQIIPNAPDMRLTVDDSDDSITLRLPYTSDVAVSHVEQKELNSKASTDERWANVDDGEDIVATTFSATDTKDLANLSCRSCGHRLLAKDANIDDVFPLPIGCWDEVADYLTCYEGQPAFDFGSKSTVADRGVILEDESVMVLNKKDLGQNVCVLAIDGYGEREEELNGNEDTAYGTESTNGKLPPSGLTDLDAVKNGAEFRGLRKWRDTVGGATLCCSQCCTTLGFASLENVEACRLFKHRLSSRTRDESESQGVIKDVLSEHTCASFLAKDMIRYAESQAVFTFLITAGRTDGNTVQEDLGKASEKGCLLLKILSWDTVVASSSYSDNKQYSTPLTRGVKVIYEFVDDYEDKIGGGSAKAENIEDIMSWTWGGVDLCCPPMANNKSHQQGEGESVVQTTSPEYGNASVQIFLTDEELAQVKSDLLAGSSLFSQAVATSTLRLKLGADGKKEPGDTSKGLSVILLR